MIRKNTFLAFLAVIMLFMTTDVFAKSYPDVSKKSKAYEAVDYLSEIGVVAGYEDGLFLPEKEITRGEAATLLARTLGFQEDYEIKSMPFDDVKEGYWAERFISYCWEGGLVNGMTETSFAPAEKVTYAQMIKMLVCASGVETEGNTKTDKWYEGYINTADKYGITDKVDVEPDDSAPRGDVAILVYNCIKNGLICEEETDESEEVIEDKKEEKEEAVEEKEEKLPVIAYKEDVVQTANIPDNYEFAVGFDYNPFFEEIDVNYDGLPRIEDEDKLLIVLDPGHNFSGMDTGAHNEKYDLWEQNITWPVADMLRRKLEYMGFEVVMTRDKLNDNIKGSSALESLLNRAGIANGLEADLFISIHCNAGGGKGVETYCFQKETKGEQLAKSVQKRLAEGTGLYDRGVKTAGFVVIKETLMPAILVETAFIDREEDLKFLASKDGQNKLSTAIAKGVYDYAVEN